MFKGVIPALLLAVKTNLTYGAPVRPENAGFSLKPRDTEQNVSQPYIKSAILFQSEERLGRVFEPS